MKTLNRIPMKYLMLTISLIVIVILTILLIKTNDELYALRTEHDRVVEAYEKKIAELTDISAGNNSKPNNVYLSDFHIELFRKKGLDNPVQDIISELMKHTELIPYEAKPGGTAGFYDKETCVLNEKWVMASVSDGHWSGYLLLEYEVNDGGNVNWKRIAAMR